MNEKEKAANELFDLGNYKSSGKIYSELYKYSTEIEDRIYFQNKSDLCKEYYKKVNSLSTGEAFFPVIGQAGNRNSVLTLRITENPTGARIFDIGNIKSAVIQFLDDYLFEVNPFEMNHSGIETQFGKHQIKNCFLLI